jgi:hypothetical protein
VIRYAGVPSSAGRPRRAATEHRDKRGENQRYTDKWGNTNTWWAKTDDDSGNKKVWVSATVFTVGGQNEPIPGLPRC